MNYIIYKTTNLINGKYYIGKHKQDIDPLNFDGYFGSGKIINNAIKKYGIENFKRETLCSFDNEIECYKKEVHVLNEIFNSDHNDCYNLVGGGYGGLTGFVFVNKEDTEKIIHKKELLHYLNNGWKSGTFRIGATKNTVSFINKNTNKIKRFNQDFVHQDWIKWNQEISNKNKKAYTNSNGIIKYFDTVPDLNEWKQGFVKATNKNYIWISEIKTGKRKQISGSDLIPEGWIHGMYKNPSLEYLWCFDENTGKETKIKIDEDLPVGYKFGRSKKGKYKNVK
jgi:hypothetical protein